MTVSLSKHLKTRSFRTAFFSLFSFFLLFLFIKNPKIAGEAVTDALQKCTKLLIPSLFPLMTASEIALKCGIIDRLTRPLTQVTSKILGIKKEAVAPVFLGLIGGYTTSVWGALSLLKDKKISKEDCERVIALSSLPSLSFLTGFVGFGILKNSTVGWVLWGICITSSLIIGLFTQKRRNKGQKAQPFGTKTSAPNSKSVSLSKIIVDAISNSAHSMLLICACVVFFSTLIATLKFPLEALAVPDEAQKIILGSLEITNGVSNCASIQNELARATTCALLIGWSGLSVHFQIMAICDGCNLSFKKYFLYKALQGIICGTLIALLLLFYL